MVPHKASNAFLLVVKELDEKGGYHWTGFLFLPDLSLMKKDMAKEVWDFVSLLYT